MDLCLIFQTFNYAKEDFYFPGRYSSVTAGSIFGGKRVAQFRALFVAFCRSPFIDRNICGKSIRLKLKATI